MIMVSFAAIFVILATTLNSSASAKEENEILRLHDNERKEVNNHLYDTTEKDVIRKRSLAADIEKLKKTWAETAQGETQEIGQAKNGGKKRRVFLKYKHGHKTDTVGIMSVADKHQEELGKPTLTVNYDFEDMDTMVVTATEEELDEIFQSNDLLEGVEEDPIREMIPTIPEEDNEEDSERRKLSQSIPWGLSMIDAIRVHAANIKGQAVKVCVIDSGIEYNNPDFIKGHLTGTNVASINWKKDGCTHGTHVAGTIAAADNGHGVIGVAPQARIHTCRLYNDSCGGNYASSVIQYAKDCKQQGARIINMSLGGPGKSDHEEKVFRELYNQGMVPIAAAGNSGNSQLLYPASYPEVISVAAIDSVGNRASFSQFNSQINIAAPGVSVLSTSLSGYSKKSGTSMVSDLVLNHQTISFVSRVMFVFKLFLTLFLTYLRCHIGMSSRIRCSSTAIVGKSKSKS